MSARPLCLLFCLFVALCIANPAHAGRLEQIEARGFVNCGVWPGVAGFATVDKDGRYRGFDTDICRIVAAAILGTPDKVHFIPASDVDIFRRDRELDLVVRRLTWTLTREASLGLMFGPIVYYDGQGFMVPKSSGVSNALELSGKHVCVQTGEGWAGNLMRYSNKTALVIQAVIVADRAEGEKAFFGGQCDAYSADKTLLGAIRADARSTQAYTILPDQISEEPLAPLVRQGDDRFFQVVRWSIFAAIEAEKLGVTSRNIEELKSSSDPDIKRLLGMTPGNGKALGLAEQWAVNVIRGVGNYGEIFDRNIGAGSDIALDRGLNRLWTEGGRIYAPPLR